MPEQDTESWAAIGGSISRKVGHHVKGNKGGAARFLGGRLLGGFIGFGLRKMIVVALTLLAGAGAVAAVAVVRHGQQQASVPSSGVVLRKLVALKDYHAAQATYSFDFTDQVDPSTLFLTGLNIHVVGTGTDDVIVDFSTLTPVMVKQAGQSVELVVRAPHLGTPEVNIARTKLSANGGLFTRISNFFVSHPGDEQKALEAAQARIGAAAVADPNLITQGETNTRGFLEGFLGQLGFTKVTVAFN